MSKPERSTKRLNLSLPPQLYADTVYVSSVLGFTASSLIVQSIEESITYLAKSLRELEASPSPDTAKRLRGQSVDFIVNRYNATMADVAREDSHER